MRQPPRSLLQTAALFASGQSDPVRETQRILKAIGHHQDPAVFTSPMPERALPEAEASARRHRSGRPLGLLDGVAVGWKDLFDFAGQVTSAGSRVLDGGPAHRDAELVERLGAAGAVAVGRTSMSEFAFSGVGLNPHSGTPANLWSPPGDPRVPGGSSSGSAVAVASGLVPVAIGTDTGGSVRLPAALNGVVGYKTSGGRWPMGGVFPLSRSLDTLGVFCHSTLDAIVVDAAARGLVAPDLRRGKLDELRLLVPTTIVLDDLEPEVLANFEASLSRLAAMGVGIERRAVPAFEAIRDLTARHGALVTLEAFELHRQRLAGIDAERMDRRIVARMRLGERISPESAATIRATRQRLIAETASELGRGVLVAFPTVPITAPSIAALDADDELFVATNLRLLRNTLLGNFLDWCGISIPNGFGTAGLPTGFLLSGGPGCDDGLLAMAVAAEGAIRGDAPAS